METVAPYGAISWPINQGNAMLPRLEPVKKMLVIFPDMGMRLCASFSRVGKVEAMNRPVPIVPSQRNNSVLEKMTKMSRLRMVPQKFIPKILAGFNFTAKGIASRRPIVKAPQNVAFTVAAIVGSP